VLSYRTFDLSKREADIAIRFTRRGKEPADHLIGRRLVSNAYAAYGAKSYLDGIDLAAQPSAVRWIGPGQTLTVPLTGQNKRFRDTSSLFWTMAAIANASR